MKVIDSVCFQLIAAGTYDPATGTYNGPDGQQYTQETWPQAPKSIAIGGTYCCRRKDHDG